jgi:hypothetical protein
MTDENKSGNKPYTAPETPTKYNNYRKSMCYKPKMHTMADMQENVKRAMVPRKTISLRGGSVAPEYMRKNVWNQKESQRKYIAPIPFFETPLSAKKPEQPKPEEQPKQETEKKEPFWDGVGWEEWAYQIYDNYPEMRKYLPEWFIEAMEQNNKKQ